MKGSFRVYGDPVAQPRHRISKSGGRYIPKNHAIHGWKTKIALAAKSFMTNGKYEIMAAPEPVHIDMVFYFKRPKRIKEDYTSHTSKPDLSNLIKAVEDTLVGIIYTDDRQIVSIEACKEYQSEYYGGPGLYVEIYPEEQE